MRWRNVEGNASNRPPRLAEDATASIEPRRTAWFGAASALCLLLACRSDAERAEQGRVANLAERIDRLRRAENPDKRPLLAALEAASCVSADSCALKDLCVRAYQVHQRALDAIEDLKRIAQ